MIVSARLPVLLSNFVFVAQKDMRGSYEYEI